jgi:hypothetical protein
VTSAQMRSKVRPRRTWCAFHCRARVGALVRSGGGFPLLSLHSAHLGGLLAHMVTLGVPL